MLLPAASNVHELEGGLAPAEPIEPRVRMLYPTSMPLFTGLALFGLSFLNTTALDAIVRQYIRRQESVGSA